MEAQLNKENRPAHTVQKMNWKLPNQLTIGRIALAGAFFVLLGLYTPDGSDRGRLLNVALIIYIVAGITDVLDGWIARKWNWTSAFGRIADPFVDKLLVVGAFVMLCGQNYSLAGHLSVAGLGYEHSAEATLPWWLTGRMVSCVQSWMVVVILGRELIVSAVRGYSESQGIKFPATQAGKIKMLVQSVTICWILFQMANFPTSPWAVHTKVVLVWLAVVATAVSGLAYIGQARRVFLSDEHHS